MGEGGAKILFCITLYVTKREWKKQKEKTNKHESDDMLVIIYDFIICHDTQIYYDNMCGSYISSAFFRVPFLTHRTLKNIHENLNK